MSRETVRMVRLGIRPPYVDPFAEEREEYEKRIAELEMELRMANRQLARLGMPGWAGTDGIGYMPWVEDGDDGKADGAGG